MSPHPLTNFEIQKDYQNKPKFNGIYSIINVLKIKDGAYVIFIGNNNIITNIYRIQTYHSIMCGYFELDLLILC